MDLSKPQLKVKTFVSTIWSVARTGIEQSLGLIGLVVLARLLTPSDFGLFTLAAAAVELATIFAAAGWSEAVYRSSNLSDQEADTLFWSAFMLSSAVAVLFALASFPIAELAGQPALVPLLATLAPTIPMLALVQIHTARKLQNFGHKSIALRSLAASSGSLTAAVIVALQGGGVWSMVVERYVNIAITIVLTFVAFPWCPKFRLDSTAFRRSMRFSANVTFSSLANYLVFRFPYFLGGRFIGADAVAHYRMGSKPLELLSQSSLTPLATVAVPSLSRLRQDRASFSGAYARFAGLASFAACPMILGFGAVSGDAIPLLFGPQWQVAISVCSILSFMGPALIISSFVNPALVATGASKALAVLSAVQLIAVVTTTFAGLPFGLEGVAVAQVARMYLLLPVQLYVLRRETGTTYRTVLAPVAPSILASILLVLAIGSVQPWTGRLIDVPVLRLVAEIALGVACYALALAVFMRRHLAWQVAGVRSMLQLWKTAR